MHTGFWSGNLKGRDHSEDLDIDWNAYSWLVRTWFSFCEFEIVIEKLQGYRLLG